MLAHLRFSNILQQKWSFQVFFFPIYNIGMDQMWLVNAKTTTILSFRNSLLKIGQTSEPFYRWIQFSLKLITRLRLGVSHLHEHKFDNNFKDRVDHLCSCSLEVGSVSYFFMHCHYLIDIQKTNFNE